MTTLILIQPDKLKPIYMNCSIYTLLRNINKEKSKKSCKVI